MWLARVVASRYALELKRRNQRSASELESTLGQSHLPPGTIVWTPKNSQAQSGVRNRWQTQLEHSNVIFRGKASMAKSKAALNLHSIPRPTFPIRISTAGVKECAKYLECGDMKSVWPERGDRVLVQTTVPSHINEGSEAGSLQCLSCQLRVVEANAEDMLRRQEQHSQVCLVEVFCATTKLTCRAGSNVGGVGDVAIKVRPSTRNFTSH